MSKSAPTILPRFVKPAYGTGALAENILNSVLNQFANSVYTITFALNPVLVGLALAIPRLWDAVFDLVVGNYSDNCYTRWGRRKPLMIAGLFLSAFALYLVFLAPVSWSDTGKFAFLLFTGVFYYTCSTLYCVPYVAMGYELTSDYDERSRLMGYRALFAPLGILMVPWLFALAQDSAFANPISGVRIVSIGVGGLLILIGLVPVVFVPRAAENFTKLKVKIPFREAIRLTLTNRVFLTALIPCLLVAISLNFTGQIFIIIIIFHVFTGDIARGATMAAAFVTVGQIAGMISAPLIARVAVFSGKKETMCGLLLVMAIVSFTSYWLITPNAPWLAALFQCFLCPATVGIFLLYHSMIADVCDADELQTGARREAIYAAVAGWIYKMGSSGAIVVSGFGIWYAGFEVERAGGQTSDTLTILRLIYALVPGILIMAGLLLFLKYPLSKAEVQRIRERISHCQ